MPICQFITLVGPNAGKLCGKTIRTDSPYCYNHKRYDAEFFERNKDKIEHLKKINGYHTPEPAYVPISNDDLIKHITPTVKKQIKKVPKLSQEEEILQFNKDQPIAQTKSQPKAKPEAKSKPKIAPS